MSVKAERDELCGAISTIFIVSEYWMSYRWNKNNPHFTESFKESDPRYLAQKGKEWQDQHQKQKEAMETIRRLIGAGVDRWIHPLLGTPPGQWTTKLLRMLRELEGMLYVTAPSLDSDSMRDRIRSHPYRGMTSEQSVQSHNNLIAERSKVVVKYIPILQKLSFQIADLDISGFTEEVARPHGPVATDGEWSDPMSKKELMECVHLTPAKFRTFCKGYQLKKINRQLFEIRLDNMPANLRRKFEKK